MHLHSYRKVNSLFIYDVHLFMYRMSMIHVEVFRSSYNCSLEFFGIFCLEIDWHKQTSSGLEAQKKILSPQIVLTIQILIFP